MWREGHYSAGRDEGDIESGGGSTKSGGSQCDQAPRRNIGHQKFAHTAKVMENNPTLMRLKELEALEKVSDKIGNLTVYGGLEGLMNGIVKIA